MHSFILSLTLLTSAIHLSKAIALPTSLKSLKTRSNIKLLISNDDGWAEANYRRAYITYVARGYDVVASSTAYNMSGTGSLIGVPVPVLDEGQYSTIKNHAAIGAEPNNARMAYVNSFPVTAVKYALSNLTPKFFGGKPQIVATGPNAGSNRGVVTAISATFGAANEAVKQGIPAIAFSGEDGVQRSYTDLEEGDHSHVYAELAVKVLDKVVEGGAPYLPAGIGLNVNFPSLKTACSTAEDFQFVFSRIFPGKVKAALGISLPLVQDAEACGTKILPTEDEVAAKDCKVSISAFNILKVDANQKEQAFVLNRLGGLLSCL